MSALKPSQFNYFCEDEEGNIIIHNTFSGIICKVSKRYSNEMQKYLTGEKTLPDNINPEIKKFFVDSEIDELESYKDFLFKSFYDLPVLDLSILTTHQCNCRCVYCYENFNDGIMSEAIQNALLKFVEEKLRTCSMLQVSWFGGEPLVGINVIRNLSPKFQELCRSMNKPYSSSMTTNGTLLTYDIFVELQKYRVSSFQITIDGTKEVHDLQRPLVGKGSAFDKLINNLKEISEKKRGKTFHVLLRVNLTKKCLDNLEEFIVYLNDLFGNDSRFMLIFNTASDWGGERIDEFRDLLLENSFQSVYIRDKVLEIISEKNLSLRIFNMSGDLASDIIGQASPGCYVNKKNFYTIDSDGKIYKCAQVIRHGFPPVVDLLDFNGLEDLKEEQEKWDSVIFPEIPDKCKKCALLPRGCWGVTVCPIVKYTEKYRKEDLSKLPLQDECIDLDQIGKKPVCPDTKDGMHSIMRKIIKANNNNCIDEIYIGGKQ